jgi:tetratricopeptide (TPR) repeat protein
MIVRNESAVIGRCLTSVRDLIDTWVICDTGSTDGTQAVVERTLAGIPGHLHERPWVDFGHNRSELMRLARGAADYLLLLDADMTVRVTGAMPAKLTADAYLLLTSGEPEYWSRWLIRGDLEWSYVGVTHEYLMAEGAETDERLESIVIDHHLDGGSRADKFERDLRLLQREVDEDATNARSVFYLAQTYRDLGELEPAATLYERRAGMGGWDEEVFYSLYQAGVLRAELGAWPLAMARLIQAFEYRPARLEPVYELASRLRAREEYETAHLFAARGLGRPMPPDILFVHPWIYRWGLLFEYSITAYWTGDTRGALRACNELLAMPDLPAPYREQTRANRSYCMERIDRLGDEGSRAITSTIQRAR